jgi:hypothetical protein
MNEMPNLELLKRALTGGAESRKMHDVSLVGK